MFPTLSKKFQLAVLVAVAVLGPSPALAQQVDIYDSGGPLMPEQAAMDVLFYDIDLAVHPDSRSIDGTVTTVARLTEATPRVVLNLDTTFTVSRISEGVAGGNRELQWERRGGQLWISLGEARAAGEELSIAVRYAGQPRVAPQAPWDGGFVWERTDAGDPWIATAVQGEGPDVWWPAKDHVSDKPDSVALHITVPEGLVVATNGRPIGREANGDGTVTFHNRVTTPISAYNIALNIAPYVELTTELESVSGEPFDVTFYALPQDREKAEVLLDEILDHLRFFERYLGPYPFRADGYKTVQTPHLGMEHQTIIAYGADFDNGAMTGGRDWGFDALHHHELAHEWWGNLVTNADWKDMWLHEGFGTYMQVLYAEEIGGEELEQEYLMSEWRYIANRSPVAPRESRTSGEIYFDAGGDIYSKGAWVLHMLRNLIGDEDFFTALRMMAYPSKAAETLTDGTQVRSATTDDFIDIAERASGRELDWFFDVYLRQPELPRLAATRDGESLRFRWQVPDGLPFPMPIEIEANGRRSVVDMTGGRGQTTVPANAEVIVDPDNRILRENQLAKRIPA